MILLPGPPCVQSIDADNSGTITAEELRVALKQKGSLLKHEVSRPVAQLQFPFQLQLFLALSIPTDPVQLRGPHMRRAGRPAL